MVEPKKREFKPTLETKLTREDFMRVDALAKAERKSKSELVREAVLWYLEHKDELASKQRETETVLAIRHRDSEAVTRGNLLNVPLSVTG